MKSYPLEIEICHTDDERIYRSKGHHSTEDFVAALKEFGVTGWIYEDYFQNPTSGYEHFLNQFQQDWPTPRTEFEDSPTRGVGYNCIELADRSEVAALQSTIAQLQARIAELESGRGEPVAWIDPICMERMLRQPSRNFVVTGLARPDYSVPLYTAPPAPVAVVLDDIARDAARYRFIRQGTGESDYICLSSVREDMDSAIDACLDATAALKNNK